MKIRILIILIFIVCLVSIVQADKSITVKSVTINDIDRITISRNSTSCNIQYSYQLKDSSGNVVGHPIVRVIFSGVLCPPGIETFISNQLVPNANTQEGL